jgi:hypothetical protein
MPTYTTRTAPVKLETAFDVLNEMQRRLAELAESLEFAAERLFPRNGLCERCEDFKADCLTVDYSVEDLDGNPDMASEVLCADCREGE